MLYVFFKINSWIKLLNRECSQHLGKARPWFTQWKWTEITVYDLLKLRNRHFFYNRKKSLFRQWSDNYKNLPSFAFPIYKWKGFIRPCSHFYDKASLSLPDILALKLKRQYFWRFYLSHFVHYITLYMVYGSWMSKLVSSRLYLRIRA